MRPFWITLLAMSAGLAVLAVVAGARAQGPSMAFVATNPIVKPMDESGLGLSFRFARHEDSSTGYGLWLSFQTGGSAAAFLLDFGVEPLDAEFAEQNGLNFDKKVGGMLGLAMGLKVKLFDAVMTEDALIGAVLFFKGMGAVQLFRVAYFGYEYGGETGLMFAIAIPMFWGIRLQVHPFAAYMPYLGGKLSYQQDISHRFDVVRAGGTLYVAWIGNDTPLLLTGAATVSGENGDLMGWAVNLGIAL